MPKNTLSENEVEELRDRYARSSETFGVVTNLARKYGITVATASRIINGKLWTKKTNNYYLNRWPR